MAVLKQRAVQNLYRVALHIGLPKTATTSLQNNVLYPAHLDGSIHYLGRRGEALSNDYYNIFQAIDSKLIDREMQADEVASLKKDFMALLKPDLLNVISEEALSLTHGMGLVRLKNFCRVLEDCDVKVLISLRNQDDFFVAYYAELYRWRFYKEKNVNTIDKFLDDALEHPNSQDYDILFYDRLLEAVFGMFPNTHVMLFEDIQHDKDKYIQQLSSFFGLEKDYIDMHFFVKVENKADYGSHSRGRLNRRVSLFQLLFGHGKLLFGGRFLKAIQKYAFVEGLYRKLLSVLHEIPVGASVEHRVYDQKKLFKLKTLTRMSPDTATKFNLDIHKLVQYDYIEKKQLGNKER